MKENFDKAFGIVIGFEGHPTNDPKDPGGFTIWGLAKKYHPNIDKDTTLDEAKKIYKAEYWDAMKCDTLSYPMDIAVFDCAVNPGIGACKEILKLSGDDFNKFMRFRLRWYSKQVEKHKNLFIYLRGWMNRVLNLWDILDK